MNYELRFDQTTLLKESIGCSGRSPLSVIQEKLRSLTSSARTKKLSILHSMRTIGCDPQNADVIPVKKDTTRDEDANGDESDTSET